MILALNKSDKIDPLIKSRLDALISGTYTTELSKVELSNFMFMKPIEFEKVVECISS